MQTQTARTQAWLADLAKIQAEIDRHGMPEAPPRARKRTRKRTRKLKPLWEE